MPNFHLDIFNQERILNFTNIRHGENKIGQIVKTLELIDVSQFEKKISQIPDLKYVIVSIPEDIGIMANLGRPGASEAPESFLSYFLNMQANDFFDFSQVLMLGQIQVEDLMELAHKTTRFDELRELTQRLDNRINPVIELIIRNNLEPIIIGGGNNNSYPIIKGAYEASGAKISCINMDPHVDFRKLEGRHSGNPFSYANEQGFLSNYFVLGLQENYNSREMLERFYNCNFKAITYEDIFLYEKISFDTALNQVYDYFKNSSNILGLELDLDAIDNMPSSAQSPFGFSINMASQYIYYLSSRLDTAYLHLSEASPPLNINDGKRVVGKTLAYLVLAYLKGRQFYHDNYFN